MGYLIFLYEVTIMEGEQKSFSTHVIFTYMGKVVFSSMPNSDEL